MLRIWLALGVPFVALLVPTVFPAVGGFLDAKSSRTRAYFVLVVIITAICWSYIALVTPTNPHPDTAWHMP